MMRWFLFLLLLIAGAGMVKGSGDLLLYDEYASYEEIYDSSNSSTTAEPATSTTKSTSTAAKSTPSTAEPTTSTTKATTTATKSTPSTAEPTTNTTKATTTTTTPTTTTAKSNTTTAHSTTTSNTTATTTQATTTPKPDNIQYKVAYDNGTVCIMVTGNFNFTISYNTTNGTTKQQTVHVPSNGTVTGQCGAKQSINITWDQHNSVAMTFNTSNNKWSLKDFTANIFMSNTTFVNNTNENKTLHLVMGFTLSPSSIAVNSSFSCDASLKSSSVSGTIVGGCDYKQPLAASMDSIQLQAYNLDPNHKDNFGTAVSCSADTKMSSLVPIIVGCTLAGLVVIVLVVYLVGRRRRAGTYESV